MVVDIISRLVSKGRLTEIIQGCYIVPKPNWGSKAMSHRYIVSSTPYLVTSGRPIYRVPTRGNVSNPNHMPNGSVHNLIQIEREENDMLDIIIAPPQEYVEDVESEQELTITIQPIQEEVREPVVKTRKIRVGNKVAVVPIETATITIL